MRWWSDATSSALTERMRQLFPGEPIDVAGNGTDVVISGTVSSKYVVEKAADVAAGYVESKDDVVNLLRQQEGAASTQILLRVRFAEVSRSALQELGASFFTGIAGHEDIVARLTTQQFAAPEFDNDEGLVFSDFLNLLIFNTKEQLGGVIKALQERGLFQSLAEPNLIAQNGKEASFLAGGEFPFPVVQGTGGANTAITIQFKEFGVRLSFTPTVLAGDLIHLKVRPEVSALDFSNGVNIEGFRIPALSTRRAETEVELRDGQTFVIAGLMNNTATETMSKIPGIGDIPILGMLFRSRAYKKERTELVVMITPQIVRQDSIGAAPALPNLEVPFLEPTDKTIPPPPPHVPQVSTSGTRPMSPPTRTTASTDGTAAALVPAFADQRPAADAGGQPWDSPGTLTQPLTTPTTEADAPTYSSNSDIQTSTQSVGGREVREAALAALTAGEQARRDPDSAIRAARAAYENRKADEKAAREQARRDPDSAIRAARAAYENRKADEKAAREQAKRDAEAAKQAAKQAEEQHKVAEKAAREQDKRDAEAAKQAAKDAEEQRKADEKAAREQAKRDAELAKRAAKQAEEQRKAAEKAAREQDKRDAEAAKQAAKDAEEQRKADEKAAREQAKRDAEAAKQAAKDAEEQRKAVEKAAREQAKREAELAKLEARLAKARLEAEEKVAKELVKLEEERAEQAAEEAERRRELAEPVAREQATREADAEARPAQDVPSDGHAAVDAASKVPTTVMVFPFRASTFRSEDFERAAAAAQALARAQARLEAADDALRRELRQMRELQDGSNTDDVEWQSSEDQGDVGRLTSQSARPTPPPVKGSPQ